MEFVILFIIVIAIVAVVNLIKTKVGKSIERYPYKKKKKLFTQTELKFYTELKAVVNQKYEVFGMVRLEDIINVEKGIERKKAYGFRGRIKSRHVDFVLCNPEDCNIVAAIELDDKTHRSKKAIEADRFKNKALKDAGLTLIRFNVSKSYKDTIENKLLESIGFNKNQLNSKVGKKEKRCKKCSSKMISKKANKGKHAGKTFLACSNYPKCKTIIPVDEEKIR